MQVVDTAQWRPNICAITGTAEGPFVDTGVELKWYDPRIYLSYKGLVRVVEQTNWFVTKVAADALEEQLRFAEKRIADLEEQLADADRFEESVKYTLTKFGQEPRRKPGRPRKASNGERVA